MLCFQRDYEIRKVEEIITVVYTENNHTKINVARRGPQHESSDLSKYIERVISGKKNPLFKLLLQMTGSSNK